MNPHNKLLQLMFGVYNFDTLYRIPTKILKKKILPFFNPGNNQTIIKIQH